ncbi:hypothetical protein OEZ85_009499 [Tetradesmus obliquus]|uniref:Uncharacterized protein n=1 Tax=Tetradesmus obliquus TaxID=3088 RepID=A0ABY8U9R5_TETOB|nr:hypothetical protein OEZ85_009499 [Tetradesmus obliquus]
MSYDDDAESGLSKLRYNKRQSELPKELQDLEISEEGDLIDRKTGKVVNEFGATRFDVAVRALRGELDPAPWVENTERSPGVLMSKLINFPTAYTFQVVGKPAAGSSKEGFVQDMVATIGKACQAEVQQEDITVKERLGGKYISMSVTVQSVRAPEIIQSTYDAIGQDPRVTMKF